MSDYIVIGQTHSGFHPKVQLRTNDDEHARKFATDHMRRTKLDVLVINLDTGLCELALTYEQDKPE